MAEKMADRSPDDSKAQALRGQGTLNHRPDSVKDELFSESAFFDARDMVQVKYEMIRRVHTDGHSVTQAAETFGFSRPSFYQAQSAFQTEGLPGLVPRKRGPRHSHKLSPEVMQFLRQLRQDGPALTPKVLAVRVRERFGLSVHPRTVERGLARTGEKR